ncbi:putative HTH-type transcriptional regulator YugG [Bacillus sp. J14TS2]|uniref:Lrp/AsnC family transcriptional regulator n=1 Tax=Bacillus sp. J14TS2 TaxID=2807188 RepID=UPI001B1797ED|nr:Lrp/AsnC family transcriptional regulator [Bacillus sp. J14TS2]GIN70248.1 putative HTH-type transcriptional regulator YugG [Bacillus sp. J14TS2]
MKEKQLELLEILETHGRIEIESLAKMLNMDINEVADMIKDLEQSQVIQGYSAVIDWSKVLGNGDITAMIDVKVAPKRGVGFDQTAERIYRHSEVKSVYLMSGTYDLSVTVEGKSMSDISNFVSEKLSTLDSVISTTTHFILKKYKHDGVIFDEKSKDKRMVVSP